MRFQDWLKDSVFTQTEVAEKLGITQSAVSHLAKGRKNPSLELMLKIQKVTKGKVRPNDWPLAKLATDLRQAAE